VYIHVNQGYVSLCVKLRVFARWRTENYVNKAIDARTRELLEAGPFLLLLKMAGPNTIAFLVQSLVSVAEVWYIGQMGTASLAAIALVFPLLMLMQMMSAGALGGAVTSALARALGGGHRQRAESLVWHALFIAAAGSLVFLLLFMLGGEHFLRFLGGSGETLDVAMDYCWILFPCALVLWTTNVLSAVFRGMGNMRFPALLMIVAALLQIPLSGALILGWGGLPALGIAGAAISIISVSCLNVLILLGRLVFGEVTVNLRLAQAGLNTDLVRDIFNVALPASLSPILTVLGIMSTTGLVGRFGPEALAGYGIGSRLEFLMVPLVFGVGAAMTSIVGVNIGAGQWQRAERVGWIGASTAGFIAGIIGIIFAIFPALWVGLFTENAAVFAAGESYMRIVGPFYVFQGIGLSLYFASQGAGNVTWPVIATIFRFVTAVGGATAAVLVFGGGLEQVFYFAAGGMLIYGIMTAVPIARGAWRP
jgi:putative MATE family efflux protein